MILSDAGVNWTDLDILSDAGVNWAGCGCDQATRGSTGAM